MLQYASIIGSGSYLPLQVLTNSDLEKMVDTSDEWIVTRTGIKERHIIGNNEKTSDMAFNAAIDAISSSSIDPNIIDLIIVATSSPDAIFPSTACMVQKKLNLYNTIPCFDLQAACAGFIYALTTADAYIKSGFAKTILLIGVDSLSRYVDYTDRNTCVLFGDGAGAVILQASSQLGIICSEVHADAQWEKALHTSAYMADGKIIGCPYINMDGKAVFKMAVKNLASVANSVLKKAGCSTEQIHWLVPHQANLRIIKATANHLSLPMDKVIVTVDKHGNTAAASVPLALDYGIKTGRIRRNDTILLEGLGAGLTWGATLINY